MPPPTWWTGIVAAGRGGKPAFIDADGMLTYGELSERCSRMGNLLRAFGIGAGNTRRRADARYQRLSGRLLGRDQGRRRAGPPQHVAQQRAVRAYAGGLPRQGAVRVGGRCCRRCSRSSASCPSSRMCSFLAERHRRSRSTCARSSTRSRPSSSVADTCPDETAFWLYSSGSTGMPKGVRHVHSSMMETARLYGQGVLGVREDDVCFSAAKLFFAYGLGNGMSFPLSAGATTILLPERPTPESRDADAEDASADAVLWRADALCGDARLAAGAARERLRASAVVRFGGRGVARGSRQDVEEPVRRRHPGRRRLDRDAAHLRLEPRR